MEACFVWGVACRTASAEFGQNGQFELPCFSCTHRPHPPLRCCCPRMSDNSRRCNWFQPTCPSVWTRISNRSTRWSSMTPLRSPWSAVAVKWSSKDCRHPRAEFPRDWSAIYSGWTRSSFSLCWSAPQEGSIFMGSAISHRTLTMMRFAMRLLTTKTVYQGCQIYHPVNVCSTQWRVRVVSEYWRPLQGNCSGFRRKMEGRG